MQPGEELEREMEEAHEPPAIPKQPGGQLADETTQAGQA
jgi:hypothetical protein